MAPRKSHPKGIDMASPNRNFVEMSYYNKDETEEYRKYLYGDPLAFDSDDYMFRNKPPVKKASHFGHSVEKRSGNLRLSGHKRAHRIGKR